MTTVLALVVALIAIAAAARSTWSPCGLSMLSSITPLAEQGRGHRYRTTALWFVVGSVLGGACLGLLMAALAAGIGAVGASSMLLTSVAAVACLVTIAADAGVGGLHLPIHRRQVNERWLDQFRPWVYGAGFGWQIGTGLATYIKTCAVYLMIVLAVLTGSPTTALLVGVVFGLVRGLAVFLGRHITSRGLARRVPSTAGSGRTRRTRHDDGMRGRCGSDVLCPRLAMARGRCRRRRCRSTRTVMVTVATSTRRASTGPTAGAVTTL